ncbi:hypothetical protein CASFOL_033181 [Castilleja foliolosa]|uniref:Uncharacterized protein n=1 Tax=Castilleja foliolosa TaxID=1961234 RepID=A0ABD3C3N0_9LAMI
MSNLGDGVGVHNNGVYQQLAVVLQQLVEMNNQIARINARAALTEARKFNNKITSRLRNVVDYEPIPKTFPGHPTVEPPQIKNINIQVAYEIGDLPPPNLLPRNDAAFAALKASRQSPLPTVRAIQWFYNDPLLGPILNDDATLDDCREFLDTLKEYIKL